MPKKHALAIHSNPQQLRTIAGGALIGAFAGLVAAFLLSRRASRKGRTATLTPMEGVQIAALLFGLLRAIAALGDDK